MSIKQLIDLIKSNLIDRIRALQVISKTIHILIVHLRTFDGFRSRAILRETENSHNVHITYPPVHVQEEIMLMTEEDDWIAPEHRQPEELSIVTMTVMTFDLDSMPVERERVLEAVTTIQCAWRQKLAWVDARRRLARAYVKHPIGSGGFYYENTITGETQWERPLVAARLFPCSPW